MVAVGGRPFIDYVVEMLRDAGIEDVLFLLGYRPEPLIGHFGDGSRLGLNIQYSISSADDETGTRLRLAREHMEAQFLLAYSDNYWPVPLAALDAAFGQAGVDAMLTIYRNLDGYTRDNVEIEGDRIVRYDKSRSGAGLSGVDIGFGIFNAGVLDLIPAEGNPSFEATVYPQLVESGRIGAFPTDHRYYSIGSHERLPLTEEFLSRRKTILIDRDGTLNVKMPRAQYVTRPDEWQWIAGAQAGLAALTEAGYRTVVITNQPGIARGELTSADLEAIHARMLAEAEAAGGKIDAVLSCPHGWNEGCECRKPSPGLLFEAQRRFNFDLTRTTFIGDDDRDGMAANAAGAHFLRVTDAQPFCDVVRDMLKGERQLANAS
jgi:D-glycero-D-manno-heptose 1,7-bisphosphate phosphatase